MYKLMIPCSPRPHRIEGAIGGTPDIALVRLREKCWRSTLPPFVENLIFTFVESPGSCVEVQKFYHLGDFFVVSNSLRVFLEENAGCAFESKPIKTKHPSSEETEQYWAMKVITKIECILPDQSFAKDPLHWSDPAKPFSDLALEVKLTPDISRFFATKAPDTYFAYPGTSVEKVAMDFSAVKSEVRLFQPLYWPQFLVIDSAFASELMGQCWSGYSAYHFWTLGFDAVDREYTHMLNNWR